VNKSALFNEQLKLALDSEEIVGESRKIDIARDYLERTIQDAAAELWQQLEREEHNVVAAETALEDAKRELKNAQNEVSAKLAAVEAALQRDTGSTSKALILEVTRGLRPSDGASLCDSARTLRAFIPPPQESNTKSSMLASELAAYMYFAATIIQYFNDSLTAQRLRAAESSGLLDELAQCRQAFVMGAAAAWQKTSRFRVACQLDAL